MISVSENSSCLLKISSALAWCRGAMRRLLTYGLTFPTPFHLHRTIWLNSVQWNMGKVKYTVSRIGAHHPMDSLPICWLNETLLDDFRSQIVKKARFFTKLGPRNNSTSTPTPHYHHHHQLDLTWDRNHRMFNHRAFLLPQLIIFFSVLLCGNKYHLLGTCCWWTFKWECL